MNSISRFHKVFFTTLVVTAGAWGMAWVFAAMAGESTEHLIERVVEKKANDVGVRRISKRFDLKDIDHIKVLPGSTDVKIRAEESGNEVFVDYHGPAESDEALQMSREGSTLNISIPKRNSWKLRFLSRSEIGEDYGLRVRLPKEYHQNVAIAARSADVDIRGVRLAGIDMNATSGDLEMHNCEIAKAIYQATSGDVEIQNFKGALDVAVTSGDVNINKFLGDELRVRTNSGDISIGSMQTASLLGEVSSGDITVKLASEERWNFDLSTSSGSIKNDFTSDTSAANKMRLRSRSGDISVVR